MPSGFGSAGTRARRSDIVLLAELGRFADLPERETVTIDRGASQPGEYDFPRPRGAAHGRLVVRDRIRWCRDERARARGR